MLFREVLILVIIIIFNIIITMIITIIFMIIIHNDCKCLSSANKWCRLSDQCPSTGFAERIIIIILSSFHHIFPHFLIFVIISLVGSPTHLLLDFSSLGDPVYISSPSFLAIITD